MTVRSNLNAQRLSEELRVLEESDRSTVIGDILDAMFTAGREALKAHGLAMPNGDGWREAESVIFDAVRRENPGHFDLPPVKHIAV